jgi:hypothetical protein
MVLGVIVAIAVATLGVFIATSISGEASVSDTHDNIIQELLKKNPLPLSALAPKRFKPIEIVQWSDGWDESNVRRLLQKAIRDNKPVLFRGSPVSGWRAMEWDIGRMIKSDMVLKNVIFSKTPVLVISDHKENKEPFKSNVLKASNHYAEVHANDFLNSAFNQDMYLYWTQHATAFREHISGSRGHFDNIPKEKEEWDILRVSDRQDPDGSSAEDWPSLVSVMQHGVTLQTFFEKHHVFVAELFGKKRYMLFPPSVEMHPYPSAHSCAHQSQVHLEQGLHPNITARMIESFPDIQALSSSTEAYEALMQPGDLLYVPPYWHQRVESTTVSISISIVTPSHVEEVLQRAMHTDVPFGDFEGKGKLFRAGAVKLFLGLVFKGIDVMRSTSMEEFSTRHFDSRYAYLFNCASIVDAVKTYECPSTEEDTLVELMRKNFNLFRVTAMELAELLNGLEAEDVIKEGFLRDFTERAVAWATESASEVPLFLKACLK